jgi:O-antigen ligase
MTVPHNDFIRILLESGIVGFIPFIMFIYLQMMHLLKRPNEHTAILCLFLFFIITAITDSTLDYNNYFTFSLFVLLGIANRKKNNDNSRKGSGG